MRRIIVLTFALLLTGATAALAQFPPQPSPPAMPGSQQERDACTPDVRKFCEAELTKDANDTFAILGCLQRNRARLSAACGKVLRDNGQ